MAGIDKLKTSNYAEYNELRIWLIKNKPELLYSFYDPFMSYSSWYQLQKQHHDRLKSKESIESTKFIIAHFLSHEDRYLYWHCPLDFIREYLENQCGYKKANWFVRLFWRN